LAYQYDIVQKDIDDIERAEIGGGIAAGAEAAELAASRAREQSILAALAGIPAPDAVAIAAKARVGFDYRQDRTARP
jgi:hypothetical protein